MEFHCSFTFVCARACAFALFQTLRSTRGRHFDTPEAFAQYVPRLPNAQMHKCTNAQMLKCKLHKCANAQMHKCANVQMLKCTNAQLLKCTTADKCSNAQMLIPTTFFFCPTDSCESTQCKHEVVFPPVSMPLLSTARTNRRKIGRSQYRTPKRMFVSVNFVICICHLPFAFLV